MTTVAYRDGVLASDSKVTMGHLYAMNQPKLHRLKGGAMLGQAGDCDVREIVHLLQAVTTEDAIPDKDTLSATRTDFEGILVLPNKEVYYLAVFKEEFGSSVEWQAHVNKLYNKFIACGSGGELAMAAMMQGASAEEAIKIAAALDIYTGGKVQTMELED